jgi:hypothetical protein
MSVTTGLLFAYLTEERRHSECKSENTLLLCFWARTPRSCYEHACFCSLMVNTRLHGVISYWNAILYNQSTGECGGGMYTPNDSCICLYDVMHKGHLVLIVPTVSPVRPTLYPSETHCVPSETNSVAGETHRVPSETRHVPSETHFPPCFLNRKRRSSCSLSSRRSNT